MNKTYIIGTVIVALLIGGAFFFRQNLSETSSRTPDTTITEPSGVNALDASDNSFVKEVPSLGTAPETNIQRPDGSEIALSEVIERNTVINSWAAWCPFCVKELADFAEFASDRKGDIDVVIVNRAESISTGSAFLEELGLSETSMRVFYDEDESMYQAFGGFSMPETVFVDAGGEIRFHKRGPLTKAELENIVSSIGW